jgi:uncharacterized protein involved in exopolysaccharide biosynthesis
MSAVVRDGERQMRNSWRERAFVALLAAIGLVFGIALALANPWKDGQPHSCPPGAREDACFLPPNVAGQRALWAGIGMVAGLLLACALIALQRRRRN